MKSIAVVLIALSLASCAFTELKPVELCVSSPQHTNNELQCSDLLQNKQLTVLP